MIEIGTKFIRIGSKNGRVETVVDVWTTRDMAGEVVCVRYVCEHEFLGQKITDIDVCATTILRGVVK